MLPESRRPAYSFLCLSVLRFSTMSCKVFAARPRTSPVVPVSIVGKIDDDRGMIRGAFPFAGNLVDLPVPQTLFQ